MKVKINIPTSQSEIKLRDYQKIMTVTLNSDDEDFIQQKLVEYICNIPLNDVRRIELTSFNGIVETLKGVFEKKGKLINRFKLDGIEFGFIPNLDKITNGEAVDLEEYLRDPKDYHKAMSVMFRPIKETFKDKYTIEDYEGSETYSDILKGAPVDVFINAKLFFWSLGNELVRAIQKSLIAETREKMSLMKKRNSRKRGAGTQQFTTSQKEIFNNLITSLNNHSLSL